MLPDGTGTIPSPFKIDTYTVRGVLLSLPEDANNSHEPEGIVYSMGNGPRHMLNHEIEICSVILV